MTPPRTVLPTKLRRLLESARAWEFVRDCHFGHGESPKDQEERLVSYFLFHFAIIGCNRIIAVSVKSRAARRQASPSIDLDKSLKDVKPPSDGPDSGFIVPQNQAQQAPKSTKKPMKRQQRLRHEKGLERANAIADRTENKVTKSKKKSKVIKARAVSLYIFAFSRMLN